MECFQNQKGSKGEESKIIINRKLGEGKESKINTDE